jgi:hypothetical protein
VKDGRVIINDNSVSTSVISAPGANDMNAILEQLEFTDLPTIEYDFKSRWNTYSGKFIGEFILAALIVLVFVYFKNISISTRIAVVLVCLFLEYELMVKHLDISNQNKALYLLVDALHVITVLVVIYLLINLECNLPKLFLLNIIYFVVILTFFYFKRCILSIISNDLLDQPHSPWSGPNERFLYFLDLEKPYVKKATENANYTHLWMEGNKITVILILLLNIYCSWKIYRGDVCVPTSGKRARRISK